MRKRLRKYGWRKPNLPMPSRRFCVAPHVAANLPSSVDLRQFMPPIVDQGDLGSCTSNSISGAIGYNQKQEGMPFVAPSRLFIYYNERVDDGDVSQDAGSSIQESVATLTKIGWCPESEWPYTTSKFATKPTAKCYTDALPNKVADFMSVPQTAADIKGAIASNEGVAIGFTVYESFESNAVASTGIMPMPKSNEQVLGGHAVLVVGYDDAKQAYLCRNSWGTSWGISGYFWMPYAFLHNPDYASDFWVIKSIPGSVPTPVPPAPVPPTPPVPPIPVPPAPPMPVFGSIILGNAFPAGTYISLLLDSSATIRRFALTSSMTPGAYDIVPHTVTSDVTEAEKAMLISAINCNPTRYS